MASLEPKYRPMLHFNVAFLGKRSQITIWRVRTQHFGSAWRKGGRLRWCAKTWTLRKINSSRQWDGSRNRIETKHNNSSDWHEKSEILLLLGFNHSRDDHQYYLKRRYGGYSSRCSQESPNFSRQWCFLVLDMKPEANEGICLPRSISDVLGANPCDLFVTA